MSLLRASGEVYKGLNIGCAPGTHGALVDMIKRRTRTREGVLDIGAHSGALLHRLRDHGFADLAGADLDPTRFTVPEAQFFRVELNKPFAKEFGRTFNIITSTDVIEHLDSPRDFLSQCHQLLADGGYVGLSTPNVAFWEGRCKFMLNGELWGFGERNYRLQRHISPLTIEQVQMMMQEVGFQIVEIMTAGSFATAIRQIVTFPLWAPIRLLGGRSAMGECLLVLAQKGEPVAELKEPVHYRNRWKGIADRIGCEAE